MSPFTSKRRAAAVGGRILAASACGAASVLALAGLPAGATQASGAATHQLSQRDAHSNSPRFRSTNLVDHGGAVLPASHVYVVFWGNSSAWSSDVAPGIVSLFQGLGGSTFAHTATQYMRGSSVSIAYANEAFDSSTPPSGNPNPSTLAAEASKEFPTADPQGMYFIFTSNFPNGGNFCAWHSYGTVDGRTASVSYMPNTTGISGCDPGNLYGVSGSEGLRSLANVTSHEFMESITDTTLSAWYDSSGSEIGDKCAWKFAHSVTLTNGTVWQLQEEWSNSASGCVQTG